MKKFLLAVFMSIVIVFAFNVWAAESIVSTLTAQAPGVNCLTFTWTSAADGSVTSTASTMAIEGYIVLVVTDPGTTAPTTLYDITLTDSDAVDVVGGALADRSATATEQVVPKIGSVYGGRWASGVLTLNITNNSVNSATGEVKIFIDRGQGR